MGPALRVFLIIGAALIFVAVIQQVRKSRVQMEDAIFWVALSVVILILSIFPQIVYFCSHALKISSPANFVFLIIIGLLLLKLFFNSAQISALKHRTEELARKIALDDYDVRKHDNGER